jgi:hypothetical protein
MYRLKYVCNAERNSILRKQLKRFKKLFGKRENQTELSKHLSLTMYLSDHASALIKYPRHYPHLTDSEMGTGTNHSQYPPEPFSGPDPKGDCSIDRIDNCRIYFNSKQTE